MDHDHDYAQGQDAKPEFTATSGWDEAEYIDKVRYDTTFGGDLVYTWPFNLAKADEVIQNNPIPCIRWQHPARSVRPDEWRPWKYEVAKTWRMESEQWVPEYTLSV